MPDALVLVSPWADLRNEAESFITNAANETVFPLASAREAATMYLAGHSPEDRRVSPVLGDWRGQPPLFIAASTSEALRDDAELLAQTARSAGVVVTQKWYDGVRHGWQLDYPPAGPTVEVLEAITEFVTAIRASSDRAGPQAHAVRSSP
jgi:acetyl esterase/lipase